MRIPSFVTAALLLATAIPGAARAQMSLAQLGDHISPLDRPARLEVADVSLPQGLAELQEQSGVPLAYSTTLMAGTGRVSCRCASATVREALDHLLTGTGFGYETFGRQVVVRRTDETLPTLTPTGEAPGVGSPELGAPEIEVEAAPEPASPPGFWARVRALFSAAPGTVRGRVTDQQTGQPVAQAQVIVLGTSFAALTDEYGDYEITGVPPGLYTLEVRRIGYADAFRENVSVPDGGTVTVNFTLGIVPFTLDELVATGLADPTSARRVPFTVARLDEEMLEVPSENAVSAIQGKVAGVSIVSPPQPGAGINIVLRTPTSISKTNAPLIVVDGVILATTFERSTADLDGLDIESVEVVKGAAAASLYGSRAASGVIQINTRRGTGIPDGQTHVRVRSEFGVNQLASEIPRSNHHHYLVNEDGEYVDTDGNVVSREDRVERPASERYLDVPYLDPTYDHIDQFFDPGNFSINSISMGRNTANTNFYTSYAYRRASGVVLEHGGYKQHDLRVNLDHRLGANLLLGVSGYHMRSTRDELPEDMFLNLVQQAPDANLLDPDPDGTPYIWQPDPLGVTPNPLYALSVLEDEGKRARTLLSADLRWAPIGWFSLDGNLSYDRSDRLLTFYFPRGKKTEQPALQDGMVERGDGVTTALNGSVSANLHRQFDELAVRTTFRALFEREDYRFVTAQAAGLTVGEVPNLDAGAVPQVSETTRDIRSEGYFLIAGLDYKDRYILDGLLRWDGSSLFGPEERWHTYYRLSGAWRMALESWWPFSDIDEFKVRYSVGTAGGRPSFDDRFETYSFTTGGGIRKATLGNRALKPERATEQEFGIDAIIADRVSVQLTHARVKTEDQLVLVPLSAGFGFTDRWENAGTVEGTTWEATIEAVLLRRPGLQWSIGFIVDRSRHEITEFDRTCYREDPENAFYRCAGERLGTMYGNKFLTSLNELPEGVPADEFQMNDDGLVVWVGPGGDWRSHQWGTSVDDLGDDLRTYYWGLPILQYDSVGNPAVVRIGDGNPDYHWGLSSTLRWKGLSVFGLLDVKVGGDVYNRTKQRMYQYFRSGDTDQAGSPDELKKTTDYYTALYAANLINSWFVEPGGYVKLRELSVRWSLPQSALAPLAVTGLDDLTLFFIGRNLFTSTDYSGYDPEVGSVLAPIDNFSYPQYRTLTAGVEIRF
ncbi:MAG: SusC/RagA family TonB-linked outer membrane protein [Gemmatimonadota bacterium]|nr:MAG: SusC/RagA family TonB-linked outer membrane protein [Gemmatimonadota bacterium]